MQAQKFKEKIIISPTLFTHNQLLADYFEVFPVTTMSKVDGVLEKHADIGAIVLDQSQHHEWLSVTHRLKRNASTFHGVIIILVTEVTLEGVALALEAGADDYMCTPATPQELVAHILMNIRRSQRDQSINPLTKLPGNGIIMHTLQERLLQSWALLWIDLDNFKAYNDYYGFSRGDALLQKTAHIIVTTVKKCGNETDFVGHVGGDDFMVISTPPHAPTLAQDMCSTFDAHVVNFYDTKDFMHKALTLPNRQGILQTFPLITLSIAIVSNEKRSINSIAHLSQIAAELKCYAKTSRHRPTGSWYVKDRRRT